MQMQRISVVRVVMPACCLWSCVTESGPTSSRDLDEVLVEVEDEREPDGDGLGDPGPIPDGEYVLTFHTQTMAYCAGDLDGDQPAFAALTAADLGFIEGVVRVTWTGSTYVGGAAIQTAFERVQLGMDLYDGGLLSGSASVSAPGPAGATLVQRTLYLDGATPSGSPIEASVGADYWRGTARCLVQVGATLTPAVE